MMRPSLGLCAALFVLSPLQLTYGQQVVSPHSVSSPSAYTGKIWTDDGPRNWIGVRLGSITPALRDQLSLPDSQGLLVTHVTPDSPAARAGLQVNDVLSVAQAAGEKYPLVSNLALRQAVALSRDEPLTLEVLREARPLNLTLTPVPLPANWRSFKAFSSCRSTDSMLFNAEDDLVYSTGHSPLVLLQAPPVIVMSATPLPADVTVTTIQTGQAQPIYRVGRGGSEWVVENQNWDVLPDDLRRIIRQAVNPQGVFATPAPLAGQAGQKDELQQLRQEIAELKRLLQQNQTP